MRGRAFVALAAIAAVAAFAFVSHAVFNGGSKAHKVQASKFATDPDSGSARATAGEGPAGGWDAYLESPPSTRAITGAAGSVVAV
jgi:hypothetical protein